MQAMLDIETLGTTPRSFILSVGLLMFDITKEKGLQIHDGWMWVFNRKEQLDLKREITDSTVEWWKTQPQEAIDAWEKGEQQFARDIFGEIVDKYSEFYPKKTWGNGPQFDCIIMETCAEDVDMTVPWPYHTLRDCRTVIREFPSKTGTRDKDVPIPHHPLLDCERQAKLLFDHWHF